MPDSDLAAMTADRDYWRTLVLSGAVTAEQQMLDAIIARCCEVIDRCEVGYFLALDILSLVGADLPESTKEY